MVAATVISNPNAVDPSYGHTDAKEFQNLIAMSAEGKILNAGLYKATVNPATLADAAGETIQLTGCTGVVLGRTGIRTVVAPYDLVDFTVSAYVQADTVIEIRLQNESGATANLASGTWYVITETVATGL